MARITRRQAALAYNSQAPLDAPLRAVPAKQAKRTYPEADLQRACVAYLRLRRNRGDLQWIAHNPERALSPAQRGRARSMGLEGGCSDILVFLVKDGVQFTTFIELKAPHGVMSDAQKAWRSWCVGKGFAYYVVRSVDQLAALFP